MTIKPLLEQHKRQLGDYVKLGWIFKTYWEKLILVVLGVLGLWKLFELIFG